MIAALNDIELLGLAFAGEAIDQTMLAGNGATTIPPGHV
jgi:hypothetical protein